MMFKITDRGLDGKALGKIQIRETRLLLVEGPEDKKLFEELAKYLEKNKSIASEAIQIIIVGIRRELEKKLNEIYENTFNLQKPKIKSIGIVRDADENEKAAIQSICRALHAVGLSEHRDRYVPKKDVPEIRIQIMPGKGEEGAIESVCLEAVRDDPLIPCVDKFSECVETAWNKQLKERQTVGKTRCSPKREKKVLTARLHKMKARAFLASRAFNPEIRIGEAAEKGVWNFDHPAFDSVKRFLVGLCS